VFFQVALAADLISSQRPSNRIDIGYMFCLPFSMVFISSDRLHKKCAPLFLRKDQEFVWGEDLKTDLARINQFYSKLPNSVKENGIMSFASGPPKDDEFLVTRLWDRHLPGWREKLELPKAGVDDARLKARINRIAELSKSGENVVTDMPQEPDWMIVKRSVFKKKGSWWQVPKDLEDPADS